MKKTLHHIGTYALLGSYLTVSLGVHLLLMGQLLTFDAPVSIVAKAKPSPQTNARPYWVTYRHIPSLDHPDDHLPKLPESISHFPNSGRPHGVAAANVEISSPVSHRTPRAPPAQLV